MRRDELIRHGVRLVAERGLAATHMSDVASLAGVPPSLVFWYFRDVGDLVQQAIVDARREIRREVAAAAARARNPLERLFIGVRTSVLRGIGNEVERVLTIGDVEASLAEPYASETRRSIEVFVDDIVKEIAAAQADGFVRDDQPTLYLAYCVRSAVHETVASWHRGHLRGTPIGLAGAVAGFVVRGMCRDLRQVEDIERRWGSAVDGLANQPAGNG